MSLISKLLSSFISQGKPVEWEGQTVHPEVSVTIASVTIKDIKKGDKNSWAVDFHADGAKYGINGYINGDEPVAKILEKAQEENETIVVRLEKKRKKNIDPTATMADLTPTMDVARGNVVKITCGVYDFKNEKWILTREAETDPANDPEGTLNTINSVNVSVDDFFNNPTSTSVAAPPTFSGNKEIENKENAIVSMFVFLSEAEIEHDFTIPPKEKRKMAIDLVKAASQIQMNVFNLEAPSYSSYSHTRARFILFKFIEVKYPINEESIKDWKNLVRSVIKSGSALWSWAQVEATKIP